MGYFKSFEIKSANLPAKIMFPILNEDNEIVTATVQPLQKWMATWNLIVALKQVVEGSEQ